MSDWKSRATVVSNEPASNDWRSRASIVNEPSKSGLDQAFDLGKSAIQLAGNALTYPGGVARTAAAYPFFDKVSSQDVLNALKGNAPSGNQILGTKPERLSETNPNLYQTPGLTDLENAKQGRFFAKGSIADPINDPGKLYEMATDPLSYAGVAPAAKALKYLGKSAYQSGLKVADLAAEGIGKGKNAVSDLFFNNNIKGTPTQIARQSEDLANKLLEARNSSISAASDIAGARPNMTAALANAEAELQKLKMSGDPGVKDIIPALEEKLASYKVSSPVDLAAESAWKTNLYNSLPQSSWANATSTNTGKSFQKTLARGLKENIENEANAKIPGLGDRIAEENAKLGTTLAAQKTLDHEAAKAIKKNALTSVDPMVFSLGHLSGQGLPLTAAKKTADVLKGTWARTQGGKALYDIGNQLPVDILLRQQLMHSPWLNLQGDQK